MEKDIITKEGNMKCHRCNTEILWQWVRGQLVFCSEKCRAESLKEGEPVEGWVSLGLGDGVVYINTKARGEP